jgi:ribonuclease E
MKRMLINATQPEELRVAMTRGDSLYDLDIENINEVRRKGNIYKGIVTRVEPSLGAAFINFGADRHGFLPFKEVAPQFYPKDKKGRLSITDCLSKNQEIIVQVEKEERGNKGAALTTFVSLAGRFLVLMPNNPKAQGISRRLNPSERDTLKQKVSALNIPEEMGIIVRTAGEGKELTELEWDLDYLLKVWDAILEANLQKNGPFLIYKESDVIIRSLRDYVREDVDEVWIDTQEAYDQAIEFVDRVMPEQSNIIKRYENSLPLFTRYQIESQIETAYQREVKLESGGSIVIDDAEALVAIDINSSKATSGKDIEETATHTNLEAAREISRQLRLRDIGGLVVIDFIDMMNLENKRKVEDEMRNSLSADRARVQIGRISRFGLLELSRQRLRSSLKERWTQDINTLSTAVLRLIEEESSKENTGEVRAIVSPSMSALLLNERRIRLNDIEARANLKVTVIADPIRPDTRFEVVRLKDGEIIEEETSSHIQEQLEKDSISSPVARKEEKAAVNLMPSSRPKTGLISKLMNLLKSNKPKEKKKPKNTRKRNPRKAQNKKHQPKQDARRSSNQKRRPSNQKREQVKSKATAKKDSVNEAPKKKISKPKKDNKPVAKKDSEAKLQADAAVGKVKETNKESKSEISKKATKPVKLSRPKKVEEPKKVEKEESVLNQTQHAGDIRASNDPRNK